MIHPELALVRILDRISPLPSEEAPLERCAGRVLAADVLAAVDLPPYDYAPAHAYAVLTGDVEAASRESPVPLRVGKSLLREGPEGPVRATGVAVPVSAGEALPAEAEAAITLEEAEVDLGGLRVVEPVRPGARIRRRGEEVRRGELLLEEGTRLRTVDLSLLAAQGRASATVVRRSRVAVLSCGAELREAGSSADGAWAYDAAGPAVRAAVEGWGGLAQDRGFLPNEERAARESVAAALGASDVLVLAGGLAESRRERATGLLAAGLEPEFWGVAIEPGADFFFGLCRGVPVFGLPGPASAGLICLEELVRPALDKLHRLPASAPGFPMKGTLERELLKEGARQLYAFARAASGADGFKLSLSAAHRLGHSRGANALARVPIGPRRLAAGTEVAFRWL